MRKRKLYKSMNPNRKVLTRDAIFAVPLRVKEVYIPEWDGVVFIKELTAFQAQEVARLSLTRDGKPDIQKGLQVPARLCAQQVVDENGQRLFSDKDIDRLLEMHGVVIGRIAKEVQELSGLKKTGAGDFYKWCEETHPDIIKQYQDEHNPVMVAEENFTTTPNGSSPST